MNFLDHGATEALLAPWAVPIIRIICVQKMYGATEAAAPWLVGTMPNGAWSKLAYPYGSTVKCNEQLRDAVFT